MRYLLTATLVATLLITLAGCAPSAQPGVGDDTPGRDGIPDQEEVAPPAATYPAPGLLDLGDGRARATGRLARVELEGGFWALMEGVAASSDAPADDTTGTLIVVIANPDDLEVDLAGLEGLYVEVEGILLDGASIRMAGPEIEARSITVLEASPSR